MNSTPSTSPANPACYDVFISYARADNAAIPDQYPEGWVSAIYRHILDDHRRFSTAPLRIFFDTHELREGDKWWERILGALRSSKMMLVCLSPNYFKSAYCRREWEEYVKRQVHQLMGSEGILPIYFVEAPGTPEQATAHWRRDVLEGEQSRNWVDLRPWFPEGAEALRREEVRDRMARLGNTLWERLQRARRAEAVPGNLRWQNPHFVGRREELRQLHEQLGTGAVGVVTAVQGLGGQGKTELAVAYAHGWADGYPAGLWSLAAEGRRELLPLIGELAWERALDFTPSEAELKDPALLGRGVLAHLKTRAEKVRHADPDQGAAALLLLDNVSEPELLSPDQLATLPGGLAGGWLRILVTTRLPIPPQRDRLAVIAVDALDEDSALSLIRDHQPPRDAQRRVVADLEQGQPEFANEQEEAAAREIVRALGGFTLAIEQVALHLGLHPEVSPSDFLGIVRAKGLPIADTIARRDADVAARMRTQNKQLGLILDETLDKLLGEPERTALAFAALLPPDFIPWPWLRELTVQAHPGLDLKDELGCDPWLTLQRRLTGLRLLTPGDQPELARLHRLVAAHLRERAETRPAHPLIDSWLDTFLGRRADALYQSPLAPIPWELDALVASLPPRLGVAAGHSLANDALFLTEKIPNYRSLPAAATFLSAVHDVLARLAASDPANSAWQRDLSVSYEKLGDLAVAQGDLQAASRFFSQDLDIAKRLADRDPANSDWQRDLSVSYEKLGDLAVAQGDLLAASRFFSDSLSIRQRLADRDPANSEWQRDLWMSNGKLGDLATARGDLPDALRFWIKANDITSRLAASDPANSEWQRDLSVSYEKLGNLAVAQGDLKAASRFFSDSLSIRQRLADSDPANSAWQRDLYVSFIKLGDLAVAQGDLLAASRFFSQALDIAKRLADRDPANSAWQRDLWMSNGKLGDLATAHGDIPAALRFWVKANDITSRLAASDPANSEWQRDLSISYEKLGNLADAQGDLQAASRFFSDCLLIRQRLADRDPANSAWQRDLAVSHFKLFQLAQKSQDSIQAETALRACYQVLRGMKERVVHMDAPLVGLYKQLAEMFGGE